MSMVNCPECDGKVSTLAEVCPHCGYPLKPQKAQDEEYVLSRGSGVESQFASTLRVFAWITWIGGLIASIAGANVPVVSRYGVETQFSFTTFITLFLSYVVNGMLLMSLATVADQISCTYGIVSGIKLERRSKQEQKGESTSNSKPTYLSNPSGGGAWTCSMCNHSNKSDNEYCEKCGAPKRKGSENKGKIFTPFTARGF